MSTKNKRKIRRGKLLCFLIGHKFTMEPRENWQYRGGHTIGHCTRCDLVAMRIPPFIYWNEYGLAFSEHREKARLLGILDKFGD